MKDNRPTTWGMIWMVVALVGLFGTLLGISHFFVILLIGTAMVYVAGGDDNQLNQI